MTRKEALNKADQLIESGESDLVYDVAADCGQIVDNVKHMRWFQEAVADELMDED